MNSETTQGCVTAAGSHLLDTRHSAASSSTGTCSTCMHSGAASPTSTATLADDSASCTKPDEPGSQSNLQLSVHQQHPSSTWVGPAVPAPCRHHPSSLMTPGHMAAKRQLGSSIACCCTTVQHMYVTTSATLKAGRTMQPTIHVQGPSISAALLSATHAEVSPNRH
jgi:hypothetical protein